MKNNIKALQLVEQGLSVKTVSKLTESQINTLHSRLVKEQTSQPGVEQRRVVKDVTRVTDAALSNPSGAQVNMTGPKKVKKVPGGVEISDGYDLEKGGDEVTQDRKQVGPSTDDGFGDYSDGTGEFTEGKKKKKEQSPWAICTAQLGKEFKTTKRSEWSSKQTAKYERCVQDVKSSLKEGKNPLSLFLENQIMKIVEKNLPPKITKGDLVNYLNEQGPAVAPTKPTTKPTTKPGTKPKPKHPGHNPNPGEQPKPKATKKEVDEQGPAVAPTKPTTKPTTKPGTKPKPKHPGHNPNPGEQPKPKATSPEEAKDKVIDTIMNLLQK